jgi:hypothetical protein
VRGVQISEAEVHAGVRVRAVFPTGPAAEVRERAQGLRRQQRGKAAQRAERDAARGRRELARLRGRGAPAGSRLWLRGPHLNSPAQAQAGSDRSHQCQEGASHLHWPSGHATHYATAGVHTPTTGTDNCTMNYQFFYKSLISRER